MGDGHLPAAATTFTAFGDLSVTSAAGVQVVTRRRERDTLAVLLAARASVSADRLLAEVWGMDGRLSALQVAISRLRVVIEPGRAVRGAAHCLVTSSTGYAVRAQADRVDTWRFEDLAMHVVGARLPALVSATQVPSPV